MAKTPGILKSATDVSIDRFTIITGTGNRIGLEGQLLGFDLFEDLFSPVVSATALIEDAFNLVEALPIIGQEWLFVSISKPGVEFLDGSDVRIEILFRVYKIEKATVSGPFKTNYILHLTKEDMIFSQQNRVARSYINAKPESCIKDIFINEFGYDSNKIEAEFDAEIEQSASALSFSINNLKPFEAIEFLASIAINTNGIKDYLFYENNGGYRFSSLSTLFKQDPIMTVQYRIKNVENGDTSSTDPYVNMTSPMQYQADVMFDYMQSLMRGQYGIQSTSFDIAHQRIDSKAIDYKTFFSKYKKNAVLNEFNKIPDNNWGELEDGNNVQPYHRVLTMAPALGEGRVIDTAADGWATRLMQLSSITEQKIKLHMPGNAIFKVGACITLNYPSASTRNANDTSDQLLDDYLSAKYIITSIRHVINHKEWHSYLELSKDSIPKELDAQSGENFTLEGL